MTDQGTDPITARTYVHEAMDSPVVRLVPAALGEAEDLAMEFLGFATARPPRTVGKGRRQALGFPAWALVHDPANGRHALAMVKELERLARLARTKPGAAKEGYDALADRLQRAVPHFLPTFWEQAGRAFLAAENARLAAVCFGAARDAERVHALAVDEDRVAAVHLEFALAGALPVKALTRYGQDLGSRLGAAESYRRYREVAVHRVAGGLAPPAGLLAELGKLAKAAGLPVADETESLLAELLPLPATARSVPGFWAAARKALVALCRREPSTRERLLALLPAPPGYGVDLTEEWVGLLDATGASDALNSTVDAVGWLERMLANPTRAWNRARSPALLALVERLLPVLRSRDQAVTVAVHDAARADLDVLDLLIAGGVAVTVPERGDLDVAGWAGDRTQGARDLTALAGHPDTSRQWRDGIAVAVRRFSGDVASMLGTAPGTWAGLGDWLHERVAAASTQAAVGLAELLEALAPLRSPAGVSVDPDALRVLADTPVAPALARSLRAGLAAELSWPAYDEAVARFGVDTQLQHAGTWPFLVVFDRTHAVVVGPEGVVYEHTFRLPADAAARGGLSVPYYVDGQLLVSWGDHYRGRHGYWSGQPTEVFELEGRGWSHGSVETLCAITLPAGGVTTGHVPLRAGDRAMPEVSPVASDGASYWRREWREHAFAWREYDPATGVAGRLSQPRFFDDAPAPALVQDCVLLPKGDTVVGLRAWADPDGRTRASDVDGREVSLAAGYPPTALSRPARRLNAIFTPPGAEEARAVSSALRHWVSEGPADSYTIHEAGTGLPASADRVNRATPPLRWWVFAVPRDNGGSQALRSLSEEQAAQLLAAPDEPADEAIRRVLPQITAHPLIAAVAAAVEQARSVARRLAEFGELAEAGMPAGGIPAVSENALWQATDGLRLATTHHRTIRFPPPSVDIGAQVAATARSLADPAAALPPLAGFPWDTVLGAEGALALRLLGPQLPDEDRSTLSALLAALAASPFTGAGTRMRVVTLTTTGEPPQRGAVLRRGEHAGIVVSVHRSWDVTGTWGPRASVIECDPSGAFEPLDYGSLPRVDRGASGLPAGTSPFTIAAERRPAGWANSARLDALLRRLATDGPPPWRPSTVERLVALTGMGKAEAALLLAGVPGIATNEANFLPKAAREALGLGATEARTARDRLASIPAPTLVAVLDAALPEDPEELWRVGPDVDRLAGAWTAHFGRTVTLDPALASEVAKIAGGDGAAWSVKHGMGVVHEIVAGGAPRAGHLDAYGLTLAALAYRLPAGDPVWPSLADALARARAWLADPSHTVELGYYPPDLGPSPALTGTPTIDPKIWRYVLTPAHLSGPDDPVVRLFPQSRTLNAIAWLLSDGSAAAVRQCEGLPVGAWPHDPRVSVPSIVESAAQTLGLDADTAAYYLQLLALPDPTDRNVALWTGWPAVRRKKLADALTTKGLVVVAKRERAGRAVFLPGGWLPLRAPAVPVEAWKAPLYEDQPPVADLFRRAWHRVREGDEPRLERL